MKTTTLITTGSPDDRPLAASYARFSSELQNETSLSDQQRHCRETAMALGYQIPNEFQFEDAAISGTKLHRPGLDDLLKQASERRFPVLVLFSLSRLGREQIITMPILKELVYENEVRVVCNSEGFDTARPDWETLGTILVLAHERYIRELSANVHRGHVGTLLANYSVGDYCFGYTTMPSPDGAMSGRGRNAKPRMVYVIDEESAPWVRRVFEWFVNDRHSIAEIVRRLDEQRAPKDHRSTTPDWHRNYVLKILRNRKYIGEWQWGLRKTVRRPKDGQIRQVRRNPAETERWTRHRPDLRIISDELFYAAQAMLNANREQFADVRGPRGRLQGAAKHSAPRHWLSKLLKCPTCGSHFQVLGSKAEYWKCPKSAVGRCSCSTAIRRDLIEPKLLELICQQIKGNRVWREQIVELTLRDIERWNTEIPAELQQLDSQQQKLQKGIARLLDMIENGSADPSVLQRLQQRREELAHVTQQIMDLRSRLSQFREAPTAVWVEEQLNQLHTHLRSCEPAQLQAVRELLDSDIELVTITTPECHRPYYRAIIRLRIAPLHELPHRPDSADSESVPLTIEIDLRKSSPRDELADLVWELYQQQMMMSEIARTLMIRRAKATLLLQLAARQRGVQIPDGRARRSSLERKVSAPTKVDLLMERAMTMFLAGTLLQEIAAELGCNRDLVTKIVKQWHTKQGLPIPDGRARRKSLELKGRPPKPNDRRRRRR